VRRGEIGPIRRIALKPFCLPIPQPTMSTRNENRTRKALTPGDFLTNYKFSYRLLYKYSTGVCGLDFLFTIGDEARRQKPSSLYTFK